MISRRSPGSRRDASVVEPTRSQNSTVSCRRSADATGRGDAARVCALDARMVSAAPQSTQNLLPGGFSAPYAMQRTAKGVPQSPQNYLPQLGHSMPHLIDQRLSAYHSRRSRGHNQGHQCKVCGPVLRHRTASHSDPEQYDFVQSPTLRRSPHDVRFGSCVTSITVPNGGAQL